MKRRASVLSQKFVVAPRTALRPPGKARRRSRPKEIRRGGATQPGGMQRRPNANEFLGQDTSGAGGRDDLGRARADSGRAHATFHAAHAAAAAPWPGCPSAVAHSSSALTTETM